MSKLNASPARFDAYFVIWEENFSLNKTTTLAKDYFFGSKLRNDVHPLVERCRVYQINKGTKHNTEFYTPMLVIDKSLWDISIDFILGLSKTLKGHIPYWSLLTGSQKRLTLSRVEKPLMPLEVWLFLWWRLFAFMFFQRPLFLTMMSSSWVIYGKLCGENGYKVISL